MADRIAAELDRLAERYALRAGAAPALLVLLEALAEPAAPTSVHEPAEAVRVHIADSLAGLEIPEVGAASRIADLGAGAGLPGLVLATAIAHTRVTLVESIGRKCEFIRATADRMGLDNVEVVRARAEEWHDGLGACDVVTARALAPLAVLAEYAAPLLREQGVLVAWKGEVGDQEAADAAAAAELLGLATAQARAVVPFAGSERRTLQVMRKVAPTPARFPRRPGMATKRPLSAKNLR